MKVLIVTGQIIEDAKTTYRCVSNFYDIIRRFSYLGELTICSGKYDGRNSHTKIEKDLCQYVKYGNVFFLKKDYLFMSKPNKLIVEPLIQSSDLVISYGSSYDLYKLAKRHNKKFMSFVVSCAWDAFWNHGWKGKMIAPYQFIRTKYTIKHSDYVLYVTNRFLQNRYPTDAKYHIGCSNVRIDLMCDETLNKRIEFLNQWDGSVLNIATTAAVDVLYKGQQYVIRAMYELKKRGVNHIHYYLLGGGSQVRLKKLVRKYGLENNVHFEGIVPHQKVFDILDKIHLYIHPSLQEGLPRSMVEAMSRGLMCCGARTAAIPELIDAKYVTKRKSYEEIVHVLAGITREELIDQAKINFTEAKKYQEKVINERRNRFFDCIKADVCQ